jgi:hypothetical protein
MTEEQRPGAGELTRGLDDARRERNRFLFHQQTVMIQLRQPFCMDEKRIGQPEAKKLASPRFCILS